MWQHKDAGEISHSLKKYFVRRRYPYSLSNIAFLNKCGDLNSLLKKYASADFPSSHVPVDAIAPEIANPPTGMILTICRKNAVNHIPHQNLSLLQLSIQM